MLRELCRAGVEGMTDMSGSSVGRREIYKELIASIISLILAILIVAFVGKWLWNTTVAELFTFVRPVRSVWQIIGVMLFLSLIN
jgi:ABC-type antimicrobial peptide transport system permease subunit